jgi:hypothetical protein
MYKDKLEDKTLTVGGVAKGSEKRQRGETFSMPTRKAPKSPGGPLDLRLLKNKNQLHRHRHKNRQTIQKRNPERGVATENPR